MIALVLLAIVVVADGRALAGMNNTRASRSLLAIEDDRANPALWAEYSLAAVGEAHTADPVTGGPWVTCAGYFQSSFPGVLGVDFTLYPGCAADAEWNGPRYGTRPLDLPFHVLWTTHTIGDLHAPPSLMQHKANCDGASADAAAGVYSSGIPYGAYAGSNVAVSDYWAQWLEARGIPRGRLFDADVCISAYFAPNFEITLKVTELCADCDPYAIKMEPEMKNMYFADAEGGWAVGDGPAPAQPGTTTWQFIKCWGNAIMHPRFMGDVKTPGAALNVHANPPLRNCADWAFAGMYAQYHANIAVDPWYKQIQAFANLPWVNQKLHFEQGYVQNFVPATMT